MSKTKSSNAPSSKSGAKSRKSATAKLLSKVAVEKLGYRFGDPLRVDADGLCAVVPILRETTLRRQYVLLQETDDVAVIDTGKIDSMTAKNGGDQNVFVRSGTIFSGETQERALLRLSLIHI